MCGMGCVMGYVWNGVCGCGMGCVMGYMWDGVCDGI